MSVPATVAVAAPVLAPVLSRVLAHELWMWRHPRAIGVDGRCIGRTDVAVDPRRAKRLAHRIRQSARRHGLPRRVTTSPLRRSADVGRWLRRWGWRHDRDPALIEVDFGRWDGLRWSEIHCGEVDAWCADFLHRSPGGGESVQALFERVAAWRAPVDDHCLIVAHAGWMTARCELAAGRPATMHAIDWPAPPRHAACRRLPLAIGPVESIVSESIA